MNYLDQKKEIAEKLQTKRIEPEKAGDLILEKYRKKSRKEYRVFNVF
jgi:hypothetical protein